MSNKQTIEYQENKIKELLGDMENYFFQATKCQEHIWLTHAEDDVDITNALGEYQSMFKDAAHNLFYVCSAYLESKNIPNYFEYFKKTIIPYYSSKKLMLKGIDYYGVDEISNLLCGQYRRLLQVFPGFGYISEDQGIKKNKELRILENILNSTSLIIKEKHCVPTSEPQVYNAVKIVCEAAFPKAIFPTQSFIRLAKGYIPDILLPTLGCAIEYKYAKNSKDLIRTIDEILIDVKGYDKHPTYKLFYAVFYAKAGIMSIMRFKANAILHYQILTASLQNVKWGNVIFSGSERIGKSIYFQSII